MYVAGVDALAILGWNWSVREETEGCRAIKRAGQSVREFRSAVVVYILRYMRLGMNQRAGRPENKDRADSITSLIILLPHPDPANATFLNINKYQKRDMHT